MMNGANISFLFGRDKCEFIVTFAKPLYVMLKPVGAPLEFYQFFKDLNARFIQFTPIVERMQDGMCFRKMGRLPDFYF